MKHLKKFENFNDLTDPLNPLNPNNILFPKKDLDVFPKDPFKLPHVDQEDVKKIKRKKSQYKEEEISIEQDSDDIERKYRQMGLALGSFRNSDQWSRNDEAIVEWETDNIKSFYKELKDKLANLPKLKYTISFNDVKEVGDKYDIEVVNYDTFLNDLPTDQMKADAPPRGVPAFGLVNPVTHKARLVINTNTIDRRLLDYVYHMLKHENVHVGQKGRKKDKSAGEFLGDVTKTKEYFSNKDEVMAFAQSVSDMVMEKNPKSMEEAIKMIERTPLWRPIQTVDEKTKKRYKKYIFLYLEREFEKRGMGTHKKFIKENSVSPELIE